MLKLRDVNIEMSLIDYLKRPLIEINNHFFIKNAIHDHENTMLTINEYLVLAFMEYFIILSSCFLLILLFFSNAGGARVLKKPYLRGDAI